MRKKILLFSLYFLYSFALWCQEKPKGHFLKDSVKIGEIVQYTFSYKYSIGQNVLFPDSTYPFTPFEFISKKYFPTVSDTVNSFDSAVYTLATYEIDSLQHLALPILLVEEDDTTKIFASPDSVFLVPTVTSIPDSVKLFENSNYVRVDTEINYSYLLIGLSVFLLIVTLFILIFGKQVLKRIKINRLRKQHYKFLVSFKETTSRINEENFSPKLLELSFLWKNYFQQLTDKPFTTYSTKEIGKIINDERLKESFTRIDKGIYAHRFPDNLPEISKALVDMAQKEYNRKKLEVKNGAKK